MAMDYATSYSEIVKFKDNEDGTLMVYGKATDDTLDLDQQICDPTWLEKAMPEWMVSGGNVREMHGSVAAGVAKEYELKKDGHYINTLIVDPLAITKVKTGVYKGFSIGIKSPRVVRDTKAVNGRIIDGKIIEISLVDRPANPSAKLIMAKAADSGDLVQVEEMHEYKAPLPSEIAKAVKTQKGSKMETIKQITELAKSLTPDTVKFDKDKFETAIKAIADLIIVEAGEITADNSERDSIENLLDALKHLRNWYQGEVEEGEVAAPDLNTIELAADAEVVKEDSCGCECDSCGENKGCDSKMCKCSMAAEKSVSKCLECGCDKPADAHGRTDVTTAQIVTPDETPKSVEADDVAEVPAEEVVAEEVAEEATPEVSEAPASDDTASIEDVVEKAVKSAMKSVEAEIASLRVDKESAVEKSVKLEADLATALSKSVAGGPKRTATISGAQSNEYLVKASTYKAKADATTDPVLRKGYSALYAEFSAKGGLPVATENE